MACVNEPETARSPFAITRVDSTPPGPQGSVGAPTADHAAPFHRAMPPIDWPATDVNKPVITRSPLPSSASERIGPPPEEPNSCQFCSCGNHSKSWFAVAANSRPEGVLASMPMGPAG